MGSLVDEDERARRYPRGLREISRTIDVARARSHRASGLLGFKCCSTTERTVVPHESFLKTIGIVRTVFVEPLQCINASESVHLSQKISEVDGQKPIVHGPRCMKHIIHSL